MAHGGEARFDRVGRAQVTPMFGREVVEREQPLAILAQHLGRLRVLGSVGNDELIKRLVRLRAGRRHPDRMQIGLGFRLHALGQTVEHIRGLVHPAALLARGRVDLGERRPKTHRAVAHRQFRRHLQPAPLQMQQDLAPALGRFAITLFNRQQLLLAALVDAHDHQRAQRRVVGTNAEMDAIGPQVDPAVLRQRAAAKRLQFVRPLGLQSPDRARRQTLCRPAAPTEEGFQSGLSQEFKRL